MRNQRGIWMVILKEILPPWPAGNKQDCNYNEMLQ